MCIYNKGLRLDITKDSQERGKGRDVPAGERPPPERGQTAKHTARKLAQQIRRCVPHRLMLSRGMFNYPAVIEDKHEQKNVQIKVI